LKTQSSRSYVSGPFTKRREFLIKRPMHPKTQESKIRSLKNSPQNQTNAQDEWISKNPNLKTPFHTKRLYSSRSDSLQKPLRASNFNSQYSTITWFQSSKDRSRNLNLQNTEHPKKLQSSRDQRHKFSLIKLSLTQNLFQSLQINVDKNHVIQGRPSQEPNRPKKPCHQNQLLRKRCPESNHSSKDHRLKVSYLKTSVSRQFYHHKTNFSNFQPLISKVHISRNGNTTISGVYSTYKKLKSSRERILKSSIPKDSYLESLIIKRSTSQKSKPQSTNLLRVKSFEEQKLQSQIL